MEDIRNNLRDAHIRLRSAAEKAVREIGQDIRVLSSFEEDDKTIDTHLYRGYWVTIFPTVKLMLIDDTDGATRALCEATGSMPKHSHSYEETVTVIHGTLLELTTGRVYSAGEEVTHKALEIHQPDMHGLFFISWRPPLPMYVPSELSSPQNYPIYRLD